MKYLKQIDHQGERFIYVDAPRNDGYKLVGVRPVSDTVVKILTVYMNDEVTVRKQQTHPRVTRGLFGMEKEKTRQQAAGVGVPI